MKYYKQILLLSSLLLSLFVNSCDIVTAPYNKTTSGNNDTTNDSNLTTILLEEYTGFKCKNCPVGARLAHSLVNLYKDRIVLVSLHSGYFAKPDKEGNFIYDFRTEIGEELCQVNNITTFPCGTINRMPYNNEKVIGSSNWVNAIQEIFNSYKIAPLAINLTPNLSDKKIDVKVDLIYSENASNQNYLSVWIIEDGIIYWQIDKEAEEQNVENYEHNAVLRYSFNGTWGNLLSSINIATGTKITKEYSYTIPDHSDWNTDNLQIVAFVYDGEADGRVLQAKKVKLK